MIGTLSVVDLIFLVTVLLLVYNGFSTGAITSLVHLLSIPLGIAVAYVLGPSFTGFLANQNLAWTPLFSYFALFLAMVLIVHIVGSIISGMVRHLPGLGFVDRLLGGVVGFIEAWLLWVVLLFILHNFLLNIHNLPPGVIITPAQFTSWQNFYNQVITHSLFAQVNSFIITTINTSIKH